MTADPLCTCGHRRNMHNDSNTGMPGCFGMGDDRVHLCACERYAPPGSLEDILGVWRDQGGFGLSRPDVQLLVDEIHRLRAENARLRQTNPLTATVREADSEIRGRPVSLINPYPRGVPNDSLPPVRLFDGVHDRVRVRESYRELRQAGFGERQARELVFALLAVGTRASRVFVQCDACGGKGYVSSFGTGMFRDHCVVCGGDGVIR